MTQSARFRDEEDQAEVAEMDLFAVIRNGQAGMVAASLALSAAFPR